jgi:hypothetical protein
MAAGGNSPLEENDGSRALGAGSTVHPRRSPDS